MSEQFEEAKALLERMDAAPGEWFQLPNTIGRWPIEAYPVKWALDPWMYEAWADRSGQCWARARPRPDGIPE